MVLKLEPDGGLEVLELAGPDLDVEPIALVRDLDDLRPGEPRDQNILSQNQGKGLIYEGQNYESKE